MSGELAQKVKCLPCMHEDLSLILQNSYKVKKERNRKKARHVARACNPSIGETEMCVDSWDLPASQPCLLGEFQVSKRSSLKKQGE